MSFKLDSQDESHQDIEYWTKLSSVKKYASTSIHIGNHFAEPMAYMELPLCLPQASFFPSVGAAGAEGSLGGTASPLAPTLT